MEVVRFKENEMYYCVSLCNTNCVWRFTCVKVTNNTVTLEGDFPSGITRRRVRLGHILNNQGVLVQTCKPLGRYRMAPTLNAAHRTVKMSK